MARATGQLVTRDHFDRRLAELSEHLDTRLAETSQTFDLKLDRALLLQKRSLLIWMLVMQAPTYAALSYLTLKVGG